MGRPAWGVERWTDEMLAERGFGGWARGRRLQRAKPRTAGVWRGGRGGVLRDRAESLVAGALEGVPKLTSGRRGLLGSCSEAGRTAPFSEEATGAGVFASCFSGAPGREAISRVGFEKSVAFDPVGTPVIGRLLRSVGVCLARHAETFGARRSLRRDARWAFSARPPGRPTGWKPRPPGGGISRAREVWRPPVWEKDTSGHPGSSKGGPDIVNRMRLGTRLLQPGASFIATVKPPHDRWPARCSTVGGGKAVDDIAGPPPGRRVGPGPVRQSSISPIALTLWPALPTAYLLMIETHRGRTPWFGTRAPRPSGGQGIHHPDGGSSRRRKRPRPPPRSPRSDGRLETRAPSCRGTSSRVVRIRATSL